MNDGVTISFPKCERCPPLTDWPAKNLIQNACPTCHHAADPVKTARALKAKRLIELPLAGEAS